MRASRISLLLLLCEISINNSCFAADAPKNLGSVSIPNTAQYAIHSDKIDEDFRLDIALPANYFEVQDEYPVVYIVDATGSFPFIVGNWRALLVGNIIRREYPEIIIVGIGYKNVDERFSSRNRDLTPTNNAAWDENRRLAPPSVAMASDISTGGGEHFYGFIENEIKPFINHTYRIDSSSETLVGHSFGALFGLYVLFNHTGSFDNFILGSPSIYWDNKVSLDYERGYAERERDLPKHVFLAMGSLESDEVMNNTDVMYDRILSRNYPNLTIDYKVYEGESHFSGMGVMINNGLRFVFLEQ